MRHHSSPSYTPEPDVVHELLGHVPMLLNPEYCALVEEIGRASLGATDKTIWHLTKVYWCADIAQPLFS
jgi:phenylalanine-4-hydroxylase